MSNIPAKNGNGAVFQLSAVTLPDGSQSQAVVLVDSTGTPVTAWPLSQGAATDAKLVEILDKLNASLAVTGPLTDEQLRASAVPVSGTFWQATQPVSGSVSVSNLPATQTVAGTVGVSNFPTQPTDYPDAAAKTAIESVRDRLPETPHAQPITDTQLRATPIPSANVDDSFLVRWVLKPLAKLTFTTTGLRIDCGGSTVTANIAANQDIRSITGTVSGFGYNSQLGQSVQQSNIAFQTGFRRNLTVS